MTVANQFYPLERPPKSGHFSAISQIATYLRLFEISHDRKKPIVLMKSERYKKENVVFSPQLSIDQTEQPRSRLKMFFNKTYRNGRNFVRNFVGSGTSRAEDLITISNMKNANNPSFVVPNKNNASDYLELFRKRLHSLANHLVKTPMAIPAGFALDMLTNIPIPIPATPPGAETTAATLAVFDVYPKARLQIHRLLNSIKKGNVNFSEDPSLQYVEIQAQRGNRYKTVMALDAADGIGDNNGINGQFTPQNVLLASKFIGN